MQTRTFIGLTFLILALLVVSTPALLDPTAEGVEKIAIRAGLHEPPPVVGDDSTADGAGDEAVDPVEARLQLKGYQVDEDGDMSDVSRAGARDAGTRRLATGDGRLGLLGASTERAVDAPPSAGDGLVLDRTGCPVFPANADLTTLMVPVEVRARYAAAVAGAQDPDGCRDELNARIEAAPGAAAAGPSATEAITASRMLDRTDRRSVHGMLVSLHEITMLSSMLDSATIADALDEQE